MNYYAYLRVSSTGQLDGDGPVRQFDSVTAFANRHGFLLASGDFLDDISGAVDGMERPAFIRLLGQCERGDAIVVERLDRLARTLMVQEIMLAECRTRGVVVYSADQEMVDQADTGADPTRKMIRQVLGAVAEWEKTAISLKLKKARDRIRETSGKCEGAKPYGQYPGENAVIETVKSLHEQGYGYSFIAHCLNGGELRTRRKTAWSKDSVRDLITRRRINQCTTGKAKT
jgi:DNA invertase Pin-like site-specific DNA recombinase